MLGAQYPLRVGQDFAVERLCFSKTALRLEGQAEIAHSPRGLRGVGSKAPTLDINQLTEGMFSFGIAGLVPQRHTQVRSCLHNLLTFRTERIGSNFNRLTIKLLLFVCSNPVFNRNGEVIHGLKC